MKYLGLATVFLLFSGNVLGSDSSLDEGTYSLVNSGVLYSLVGDSKNGTLVTTIDGKKIYVGLTAWSDTGRYDSTRDSFGGGWTYSRKQGFKYEQGEDDDLVVDQGRLDRWTNSGSNAVGYGLINKDSTKQYDYSVSSDFGDAHTIDNRRTGKDRGKQDFDMVLLSFSEKVTLTSGSFSTIERFNTDQSSKEVSVVGLDDIDKFQSGGNFTWSDIVPSSAKGATGHFSVESQVGSYHQSKFIGLSAARYWLVGAYNTIFDGGASQESDFGFKLSALGFSINNTPDTPSTEVSEPGALALMSLGLGLVLYRRKRRA
ncbi:exosortase-dependent surface protein XDP1 [Alteromonas hispanica]|uniref:PEP-CTERM sorting domain-containing protein n=1 Tax=Alteromonas hispanica TaxID=315421 RepID=A0A6L9MTC8_9ALTE|nr:exosortase-dependent surface protein XDP1 [Alteromonas hispanica]NDW21438.1 PEP-CTERM sorting domain-containing protein [Alteromonas hispanica]